MDRVKRYCNYNTDEMNNKKIMPRGSRLDDIDIAKGITIILMIIGHSAIPRLLSNFIFAFHMPLFFLVSGLTTSWSKYSLANFIKHRSRTLLIPFFIYSTVVLTLMEFTDLGSVQDCILNGWGGYSLWFILVLFLSSIVVKVIVSIPLQVYQWLIVFGLTILGAILSYQHLQLPWSISSVPYAAVFVFIGSKAKDLKWLDKLPFFWLVVVSFLLTCLISQLWRLDMAWNNINPVIPLTIGALAGSLFILQLSRYIQQVKVLSRIFVAIGRETYLLVAFSQIIIMILIKYTNFSAPLRYLLLVVVVVVLKFIKDKLNLVLKFKLL